MSKPMSKVRALVAALVGLAALQAAAAMVGPQASASAAMNMCRSGHPAAERCPEPPRCTNEHLTASYKQKDAAAGTVYGRIVLKNTSDEACWVRGYGGLSYVGDGDGTQVGAPAERTPGKKPTRYLLPGERVRSAVSLARAELYSKKKCKPAHVDGFRVYVPNATKSQYVPHMTVGCRNEKVHLLAHKAYK